MLKMKVLNTRIKSLVGNIKGYRGEIMAKFKPTTHLVNPFKFWWQICMSKLFKHNSVYLDTYAIHDDEYFIGDRIAQLIIMPYPEITFTEVDELLDSDRGTGGYGSSGQ